MKTKKEKLTTVTLCDFIVELNQYFKEYGVMTGITYLKIAKKYNLVCKPKK